MSRPRTRTLAVDRDAPDPAVLAEAAAVVRRGGLVAFATETVYGLGADATNPDAVRAIFTAKGRPSDNPLIVHVADEAMARRHAAAWPDHAARLAELWPGPLTLVLPKAASISALVTAGLSTVGLRVPAPAVARGLIAAADRPLAAPSANRSEHVSPTTAEHVLADLDGRIDLVLDSGPTDVGIESTVIDVCEQVPRLLRPGPVSVEQLGARLGRTIEAAPSHGPARSPGLRPRHYAPRAPTVRVHAPSELVPLAVGPDDVVIVIGEHRPAPRVPARLVALPTPQLAARSLYATLRACDAQHATRILVVMPPDEPAWHAVRDRLQRATTPA
ncbi:L-threonylcarbamoyladenylate synthase [Paraliomyxa miuraensis]|uniref:L-threonylcarbamoyladenylate synthase n=1 Tax=Paraliomyxa miuraensis TaxID=376150 RepID=UPI0022533873|nr:L-threonylcarbamoyladenylate synthase [Paraliomyxa miuraensis]MCX4248066.1 L-threonylcarbamoyladenylate synthase [Paraliomyxa miuraensis]